MGKLFITVHSCHLHQPIFDGRVHPRVSLVVDERFTFHSRAHHGPTPVFKEKFSVSNIHHLAVIEVSVEHVPTRSNIISGLLSTAGGGGALKNVENGGLSTSGGADSSKGTPSGTFTSALLGGVGSQASSILLGRCQISVRRLADGVPRTRTYYLSTVPRQNRKFCSKRLQDPVGVVGTITMTLELQKIGYPNSVTFNDIKEWTYHQNLARLFLQYDPSQIERIDIICANVREPSEAQRNSTWEELENAVRSMRRPSKSVSPEQHRDSILSPLTPTGSSKIKTNSSVFLNSHFETFEELMKRICDQTGWCEPDRYSVTVTIEGCSSLFLEGLPFAHQIKEVYAVVRTPLESYETTPQVLKSDPVLLHGCITLDIVDTLAWYLHVVLLGKGDMGVVEIGRSVVSIGVLSKDYVSRRCLFLCSFENAFSPTIRGILHFTMLPRHFGAIIGTYAPKVDSFYERLSKFFRRYDIPRVPEVDVLMQLRLLELEELMEDLVAEYGREPNTVKIAIHIDHLSAMRESQKAELHRQYVVVRVSLGESTISTKPLPVRVFVDTVVNETFEFDVVRDTDLLHIEIVNAVDQRIIYGAAVFSFLNIVRGAVNDRRDFLVGDPGSKNSYLSGRVHYSLKSQQLGHDYQVDSRSESMFRGRLIRYLQRRLPEDLHRVGLIVATVFDVETFMARLAAKHGDEDTSYVFFFTVMGCRNIKFRVRQPHIVVASDISTYTIKIKHGSEMDCYDSSEFFVDRLADHEIFLALVDHDNDQPRVVASACVPLRDVVVERQYDDSVPLYDRKLRNVGSIRIKYVVRNLDFIDKTRVEVVKSKNVLRDVRAVTEHVHQNSMTSDDGRLNISSSSPPPRFMRNIMKFKRRIMRQESSSIDNNTAGGSLNGTAGMSELIRQMSTTSFDEGPPSTVVSDTRVTRAHPSGANIMDRLVLDFDDFERAAPLHPAAHSRTSSMHRDFEFQMYNMSETEDPPPPLIRGEDLDEGNSSYRSNAVFDLPEAPKLPATEPLLPTAPAIGLYTSGTDFGTVPLPPPPPPTKILHVRVFYCSDLHGMYNYPPSPFVMLSTVRETLYTSTKIETSHPRFEESFQFRLDAEESALRITVLTPTIMGTQKLGHCVLSLRNVQRRQGLTRRVPLVVDSHTRGAFEQGFICLSLMGENFGLDYVPSSEEETRLRQRLQDYFTEEAREQLHRVEWFVGEYHLRGSLLWSSFQVKNGSRRVKDNMVPLEITVHSVSSLFINGWHDIGKCMVRVNTDRQKRVGCTGWASNSFSSMDFKFEDVIKISVSDPRGTTLNVEVLFNEKNKLVGECYIPCPLDSTPLRQKHTLVMRAQTPQAYPSGYIELSVAKSREKRSSALLSQLAQSRFSKSTRPSAVDEEDGMPERDSGALRECSEESSDPYQRMVRYYSFYKRDELAMVAVQYATIMSVDHHLETLQESYGPEPGKFHVKITIRQCKYLTMNEKENKEREMGVLLRCGLQEYCTGKVLGTTEFKYTPPCAFDVEIGIPPLETVELIVVKYRKHRPEEIGRTKLLLQHIRRNESKSFRLPLVFRGEQTNLVGSIYFDAFSSDFGLEDEGKGIRPIEDRADTFQLFQRSSTLMVRSVLSEPPWVHRDAPPGTLMDVMTSSVMLRDVQRRLMNTDASSSPSFTFNPNPIPVSDSLGSVAVAVGGASLSSPHQAQVQSGINFRDSIGSPWTSVTSPEGSPSPKIASPSFENYEATNAPSQGNTDSKEAAVVTLDSLVGMNLRDEEIQCKIVDQRRNVVLRTKFSAERFRVLRQSFRITELNTLPSACYTLIISYRRKLGAKIISSCQFCLTRCVPGTVTQRQLRLFHVDNYHFIGFCILKIQMPPLPHALFRELRPLPYELQRPSEEILDEVSSVLGVYQPTILQQLDVVVFRAVDIHRLHDSLRDHLIPKVTGSVFLGVCEVKISTKENLKKKMYISAESNGDGTLPSVVYADLGPPANGIGKKLQLPYAMLRVDLVSPTGDANPTANAVTIRVGICRTPNSIRKGKELGRAVVSVRAVLTAGIYQREERIRVPLVSVTERYNAVDVTHIGEMTIVAVPLMYSELSPRLYLPVPSNFDKSIAQHYFRRLWRFGCVYDASLLLELHFGVFEKCLQSSEWKAQLISYLHQLVQRYGPEPAIDKSQSPQPEEQLGEGPLRTPPS